MRVTTSRMFGNSMPPSPTPPHPPHPPGVPDCGLHAPLVQSSPLVPLKQGSPVCAVCAKQASMSQCLYEPVAQGSPLCVCGMCVLRF